METVTENKTRMFKRDWRALLLAIALFAGVYIYYYPPIHGIDDEAGYINLAYVWVNGTTSTTGTELPNLFDFEKVNGREISWRSPGRAAALFPFLAIFGGESIFISSLLIHLLTTLVAAGLLQRNERSPLWALLILFHPTLMLYSRTVMSDELGAMFLLLALSAVTFKRNSGLWAGSFIGLAALARLHAAFAVPFVAAAFWFDGRRKQAVWTVFGASVIGGLIIAYNYVIVGSPILYLHAGFAAEFLPARLAAYIPALLILFPLQLFSPIFDDTRIRWYSRSIAVSIFVLLLFYVWNDSAPGFLENLVVSQRLLILILPIWLISYAVWIERIPVILRLDKFVIGNKKALVTAACCGLLILQVAIFEKHQEHLLDFRGAIDEVAALVPARSLVVTNRGMGKFLGTPAMGPPPVELVVDNFPDDDLDEGKINAASGQTWFIVFLKKTEDQLMPPTFDRLILQHNMKRLQTTSPGLFVYRAEPRN